MTTTMTGTRMSVRPALGPYFPGMRWIEYQCTCMIGTEIPEDARTARLTAGEAGGRRAPAALVQTPHRARLPLTERSVPLRTPEPTTSTRYTSGKNPEEIRATSQNESEYTELQEEEEERPDERSQFSARESAIFREYDSQSRREFLDDRR